MKLKFLCLLILTVFFQLAYADIGPVVMVQGQVGNFDGNSVELTTANGTKIEIPRFRVKGKVGTGQLSAHVFLTEIKTIKTTKAKQNSRSKF